MRNPHFLLATRSTFYSLLSWLLPSTLLAVWVSCPTLDDHDAPKRLCFGQKALNRGTHPQTSPGAFHPVKTWTFAILSPVEFLAKMAYGSGMKKEDLARIFDPFFTTGRGKGGSGLGMHIVYNLATQTLGGQIECRSSPGEGVRVSIRLPS